jgi:hypothetical protein
VQLVVVDMLILKTALPTHICQGHDIDAVSLTSEEDDGVS